MDTVRYFEYAGPHVDFNHVCYSEFHRDGFRLHTHDTFELIYLKNGSITYTVEGKCYQVESGDCILTRPGAHHSIHLDRRDIYERYIALFDKSIFSSDICERLPKDLDVIQLNGLAMVEQLFSKTDFYAAYLNRDALGVLLPQLIEELFFNFSIAATHFSAPAAPRRYTANPIVTKAVTYIEQHLNANISLELLSSELHVTKSYLHQLFIQHLQISPKQYLISKRLDKARMAIRSGRKPTEVFSECGFQDYCTFYRNYLKHFGYPPSEECRREPVRMIEW